jgi:HAD superfamily hydrolase (TIGR01484 family)
MIGGTALSGQLPRWDVSLHANDPNDAHHPNGAAVGMSGDLLALATDYDGTIATRGIVDDSTAAALLRARQAGKMLLLVSGRELDDLRTTFSRFDLFDLMVLENGGTIYEPATQRERALSHAPPPEFAGALRERGVEPLSVGRVIVATTRMHETAVRETIRRLGLEYQVILNKSSLMAVPSGVDKATGLAAALAELGISPRQTVAVGDAENDHALLALCGVGAAVANAVDALRERADFVATHDRGAGVAEVIDAMLGGRLSSRRLLERSS